MRLRRAAIDFLCWVRQWGPIAHAVCYVEPDGTREVDFKQMRRHAVRWADWCRRDGCLRVEVYPLYTEREIKAVRSSKQASVLG